MKSVSKQLFQYRYPMPIRGEGELWSMICTVNGPRFRVCQKRDFLIPRSSFDFTDDALELILSQIQGLRQKDLGKAGRPVWLD